MNEFFTKQKARLIIGLALILFIACETDPTKSVYVQNQGFNANPVVTGIEPAGGALSGIGQITINGSNFSTKKDNNVVFFGSTIGNVLSATASQLIVQTPTLAGDSIEVKVSVVGALLYSNLMYYPIETAVEELGGYGNLDEDVFAVAVDTSENVYAAVFVSPQYRIDLISPDSLSKSLHYGTANITTRGMKVGPGGYLYLVKGSNKILYRIPPGGGNQQPLVLFPQFVADLDFDPVGNIYVAGGDTTMSDLFVLDPSNNFESVADYTDIFIRAVRVYGNHVYLAGFRTSDSLRGIWRNEIFAPNNLGPNEMVFDVTAALGPNIDAQSLTFSEDGDMYIGTTAAPDPILIVHPNGSHEPLYPGVLDPDIFDMAWGNGVYLYASRRYSATANLDPRLLRINMQKLGAPNYGRQL